MTLRACLLNQWLRRVEKPAMARASEPQQLRRRFEVNAKLFFHAPFGTQMQWQVLEHGQRRVEALEVVPRTLSTDVTLLYIHGGGFVFGSPRAYAAMAGNLGKRLGSRVVLPRYRLAPEAPFPAAPDDVRTVWDSLCATGLKPDQIVVGGDSAGGALALALLGELVAEGAELPGAVFCFSPLTDMRYESESLRQNAAIEAVLPTEKIGETVRMYLQGHPVDDPRASPLLAKFEGASPVWITAGDTEVLRDDARHMAAHLTASGVTCTYDEKRDLPHVWPLFHNTLPEARETLDDLAGWIRQQLGLPDEN
ncbi:MAG: alpha/beta hydrolase fold domain-containing protein [Sulfitobacter sp.]